MSDGFNRRSLLQGVVAVSVLAAMPTVGFASMAGATGTGFNGVHLARPLQRFRSDLRDPTTWMCPAAVELTRVQELAAGSQLTWTWDARLATAQSAFVVLATRTGTTEIEAAVGSTGSSASLSLPLDSMRGLIGAGQDCVAMPAIVESASISDTAFGSVTETSVVITSPDGDVIRLPDSGPVAQASADSVWAASLSVLWGGADEASTAASHTYPSQVLITSEGPDPIPAGTVVLMQADSRAVATLGLLSAESGPGLTHPIEATAELVNGAHVSRTRLLAPIPAGAKVTLKSEASTIPGYAVTTEGRAMALVAVVGPQDESSLQRQTGAESVTLLS